MQEWHGLCVCMVGDVRVCVWCISHVCVCALIYFPHASVCICVMRRDDSHAWVTYL